MLNKVPEITVYFWVIKVLCTTVGETAADLLNENLGLGLTNTTYIMAALLIAVLVFQFRSRKYMPGIYWLAVVLISVVGTLFSDNLVDNLGVELQTTTIAFGASSPGLRLLVLERENPLGPHDRHHPPRGLLLAGGPLHLRPRHLGRRPGRGEARTRLPAVGRDLRRGDRGRRHRPLPLQAERDPRLLDRLHPHPAPGRVDRRLPLAAGRRNRPRPGDDPDQRHLPGHDPRPRRLPDDHQARPDRGLQRGGSADGAPGPQGLPGIAEPGVLVVTNKTEASPALVEAIRERAAAGPARFFLLVPNPDHLPFDRVADDVSDGEEALRRALPHLQEKAGSKVEGRVAASPNAYDDIVEALKGGDYREIILETLPAHVSHWLHVDLPERVAHLGYPLTTVTAIR